MIIIITISINNINTNSRNSTTTTAVIVVLTIQVWWTHEFWSCRSDTCMIKMKRYKLIKHNGIESPAHRFRCGSPGHSSSGECWGWPWPRPRGDPSSSESSAGPGWRGCLAPCDPSRSDYARGLPGALPGPGNGIRQQATGGIHCVKSAKLCKNKLLYKKGE